MILDLIILAILIICAVSGYVRGAVFTLVHTVGWIVALVGAFFATPYVSPWVRANTAYYAWLKDGFNDRFSSLTGIEASENSLPENIRSLLGGVGSGIADNLSDTFADLLFALTIFVVLFLLIKVVLWIVLHTLSREYNGHVGVVDGIFGLLIGLLKGAFLVFLFLLLLLPFINLMAPNFTDGVVASLNSSRIAKPLYDNNLLLILLHSLFT
jgi:uncharacterized membrane protein required for colicin V production